MSERKEVKIVLSTLMHGRHKTWAYCLNKNRQAGLEHFVYGFTEDEDKAWCFNSQVDSVRAENIVWLKAQKSVDKCKKFHEDLDAILLMGSDDYVDTAFVEFIERKLKEHDYIAFTDMRFYQDGVWYLWPGYPEDHPRHGEPAGAGKVVRRDLLDAIGWQVFSGGNSVDLSAHTRLMAHAKNPLIVSAEYQKVLLVDVKDKDSLTPIRKFPYLIEL